MAVNIFKETADKGNPSAQLRYGICLWKGEGIAANSLEASRYLKNAASSGNSTAMFIIGKAYWNGGNGIKQDREQGARYLREAVRHDHPKASEMYLDFRGFGNHELIEKRCKECDSQYRISEGWTSGDVRIDTFIKDTMYETRNSGRWLEWISFDRFTNIELYEDGFDKVYVAVWLDSRDNYLEKNGILKNESQPVKVFLKQFNLSADCLNEIKNHWEFSNIKVAISSKFYGMSKHPETQEFIMVTHYGNQKSLRTLLENDKKLLWKQKIEILRDTSFKLRNLHDLGYSHNNFHYGSIMLDDDSKIYITNFKLTQSIKQQIAPNNKGRPEFGKGTPKIYKDFVNQCINANPDQRPTAKNLYKKFKVWYNCIIGLPEYKDCGETVKSAFSKADNYNDEDVKVDNDNMDIDEKQLHEEMINNEENNLVVPDDLNGYTFNKNNSFNYRNLYIPPISKVIMQGLNQKIDFSNIDAQIIIGSKVFNLKFDRIKFIYEVIEKAISFLDTKAFKFTDDRAQFLRDLIQKDNTLTEEEKLLAIEITDPPYFFIIFTIRKAISLLDPKIYTTNSDRLRFLQDIIQDDDILADSEKATAIKLTNSKLDRINKIFKEMKTPLDPEIHKIMNEITQLVHDTIQRDDTHHEYANREFKWETFKSKSCQSTDNNDTTNRERVKIPRINLNPQYYHNKPEMNPLFPANYMISQNDNGVSGASNIMTNEAASEICVIGTVTTLKGACSSAQNFEAFIPLISTFLKLGEKIINLYDKAKHNKELCGLLLQRSNGAMVAVRDLDMRKTENAEFFSKQENLEMFKKFIRCMEKIKKFISRVSKLHRLIKYFWACNIEQDFTDLVAEFDGYMRNLNFSFIVQSRDELGIIKNHVRQIKEILNNVYGVNDRNYIEYLRNMHSITEKIIEFQKQYKYNMNMNSSEVITRVERNEPLLDHKNYQKINHTRSKRIEKRISVADCTEVSFKEFSNANAAVPSKTNNEQAHSHYPAQAPILIEIRKESANILVNIYHKVRIANFGLSKRLSDITRSISHNLENIRYMAPEKLFLDNEVNNSDNIKKSISYDAKCEVYSVGALLWEIAELKKPHSDLDKSEILNSVRKRIREKYYEPFSNDVPSEWRDIVSNG
ncbi:11399_t:CDS:10, partial [Funneliformis mosseae]